MKDNALKLENDFISGNAHIDYFDVTNAISKIINLLANYPP